NVEAEFAQLFQAGPSFEYAKDRKRIEFPHRGLGPEAVECEMELSIFDRQFIVRQAEVAFQPFEKSRFEDSATAIEGVAGEPYQFRPAKAEAAGVLHLVDEFLAVEHIGETRGGRAVVERERHASVSVMLPDKLEHQQLVEIGVEQRTRDRIEFPVVVVRAFGEVDDHSLRSRVYDLGL